MSPLNAQGADMFAGDVAKPEKRCRAVLPEAAAAATGRRRLEMRDQSVGARIGEARCSFSAWPAASTSRSTTS